MNTRKGVMEMKKMTKILCALLVSGLLVTSQAQCVVASDSSSTQQFNNQITNTSQSDTTQAATQSTESITTEQKQEATQSTESTTEQKQEATQSTESATEQTQAATQSTESITEQKQEATQSTESTTEQINVTDTTDVTQFANYNPKLSTINNGASTAYMLVLDNVTNITGISSVSFSVSNSNISTLQWYDGIKDTSGRYIAVTRMKDFKTAGLYTVTAYISFNTGVKLTAGTTTFNVSSYTDPTENHGNIMSILGDSISTYMGYTPYDASGNYYDSSMMSVSDTWWEQFMAQESLTLGVNESLGGSRVSWDGTTENSTLHQGANYYMASGKRIQNLGTNGTPDLICFFGGTNDILSNGAVSVGTVNSAMTYGKVDDFADAYFTALLQLQFYYPNAQIYCMTSYPTIYTTQDLVNQYDTVIQQLCEKFGYTTIDLRNAGITVQDEETKDYIHLNESGMDKVTNMIEKTLNGDTNGQGCWKKDWKGNLHYYYADGTMAKNTFISDGTYTYYLQADGTPMKNRLTYHPDGVHLIYFDENGHELFDQFKFCLDVGYTCYFNTYGYAIFDQITFYKNNAYYLNACGKMENNGWFKFANGQDIGYANWSGKLTTNQFSYDQYNRMIFFHWNGMVARGLITDGVWYYDMDKTDGHFLGKFQQ